MPNNKLKNPRYARRRKFQVLETKIIGFLKKNRRTIFMALVMLLLMLVAVYYPEVFAHIDPVFRIMDKVIVIMFLDRKAGR